MGKNFVVGDAVVGKIKKNQNRSGSIVEVIGAGHKCRIRVKWSDGTTTEETVRGIDKEGVVEENQRCRKRKNCDLDKDVEEGGSEISSSDVESESSLSSDDEPTIPAIEENRFVNWGVGPIKLIC
jgi:hypothetical protein